MQAKEKYPQHNVSNSKENLRGQIIQTALIFKKVCKQSHNENITEPATQSLYFFPTGGKIS
jgi:hypothetical protein